MRKRLMTLLLTVCLLANTTGCAIITGNEGSWELYVGVRTKQIGNKPARVEIQSTVVEKIVDSFTDGKVSPDEQRALIKILWWTTQWYFDIPGLWDLF